MIWKLIIMFFGYVLLKALRDKITFDWRIPGNDEHDKRWWHRVGFVMLVWLAFWSVWLATPLSLHFGAVMLLLGCGSWWVFEIALNKFRGKDWNHIGDTPNEKKHGKNLMMYMMILTFIAIVLAATI